MKQKLIPTLELLRMLKGTHTLESIKDILEENRIKPTNRKAIYLIYRLRKKGYVKTQKLSNNKRLYNISLDNKLGGTSYTEIINKLSPLKIWGVEDLGIYGRKPSLEETLIYAIKTKDIRTITAAISLFKKINNWPLLYKLARKEGLQRQVGALYDIARKIIKTRKMTKRLRNLSLPKKNDKFQYIKEKFKSSHFQDIENKWKVYIPLNWGDLEEYKNDKY